MWWRRKRRRPDRLLVGLGNPGARYADTRHNAGTLVLERLAERRGGALDQGRYRSRFGVVRLGDGADRGQPAADSPSADAIEVGLLAPQTYMNRSGEAVAQALADLPVSETTHFWVIFDDVDLPFGRLRLRPEGGAGGHRGLADIIERLGRSDFPRLRFGIGRPPAGESTADYVLRPFSPDELVQLPELLDRACDALEYALRRGIVSAMNAFNS